MEITNWQVFNFINIVSRQGNEGLKGVDSFAIAMTKSALSGVYSAILESKKVLDAKVPKGAELTEKENTLLEEINAEWTEILNTKVTIDTVPALSIDAMKTFDLNVQEAEFILNLPFIVEYVGVQDV